MTGLGARQLGLTLIVALLLGPAVKNASGEEYKVDPVHSSVVFRVKHLGISYCYGRFNKMSGVFHLDEQTPAASQVDITVAAASIDTANAERDQHLKNADFFDVEKYPTIRFQATKVSRTVSGPFVVAGNLTLHGATRPVTVEIEPTGSCKGMFGEVRSGLETSFTIRRSEYGMDKMIGPVGDEVRMMVSLEGIRQ